VVIRGYRGGDEEALLALWNQALPLDAIDPSTFRRKVLLDPNFDPEWLLVAEADARPIGLCLCLIRRVPFERAGLEPEAGWITAFGVHPEHRGQRAGSVLLERAFELFGREGRRTVSIAPYVPNYFVPGVDVRGYADGLAFLERRGFAVVDRPMSMDARLAGPDLRPWVERGRALDRELGVEVRALRPTEIPDLMGFLRTHMPDDWVRHARQILDEVAAGTGGYDQFTVAVRGEEVVGYCQFEGEHFGPFGVREEMQGKGIGTVLLAACLQAMQRRGLHAAFVLWTSDENADKVYSRFGFEETRRFAVMQRRL
jgi:GNAT superfamily N-acetyltransferase